jgi:hypothetical protein
MGRGTGTGSEDATYDLGKGTGLDKGIDVWNREKNCTAEVNDCSEHGTGTVRER